MYKIISYSIYQINKLNLLIIPKAYGVLKNLFCVQ